VLIGEKGALSLPKSILGSHVVALAIGTGVLGGVSFILPGVWVFIWIAFVPLLVATECASLRTSYLLALVSGVTGCAIAYISMIEFFMVLNGSSPLQAVLTSVFFWLYSAQLPALMILSYKWISKRSGLPSTLIFPVCATFFFSYFPALFPMPLSATQVENLPAIQAISITGVHGLDFLIALTNVAIAKIILGSADRMIISGTALGLLIWFGYGFYAVEYWDNKASSEPKMKIGLVQPDQRPLSETNPGVRYNILEPLEMKMTKGLVADGAELVVWPEAKYKRYLDSENIQTSFQDQVKALNTHLIFQDTAKEGEFLDVRANMMIMIDATGSEVSRHVKSKLVPFGETLPLFAKLPLIESPARNFFRNVLREIVRGTGTSATELTIRADLQLSVVPLICYESLFPVYTAQGMPDERSRKLLVGASNNSWFGQSQIASQHMRFSILRAVELRSVLIHAMNNGPSGVYLPNGREAFSSKLGEQAGFLVQIPVPPVSSVTPFNRYPHILSSIVVFVFWGLIMASAVLAVIRGAKQERFIRSICFWVRK
jgi:apolipoprotein N-acyltransferase